jgi:AcrR family transcriptional regulator
MTLYREFKDKQTLFDTAFLRNVRRHWLQIAAALEAVVELDDWLVEAVLYYKRTLTDDRTLRLYAKLGAFEHGLKLALTPTGLAPVVSAMQSRFDAAATQGRIAPGLEPEDIAEWAHRMNHSLITIPGERLKNTDTLRRWLGAQVRGGIVTD